MVNIYEELYDDDGNTIPSRTKLFVPAKEVNEDGSFTAFQSGILVSPGTSGYFYIVDSWILNQVEKLVIVGGALSVRDGEELNPPPKSDIEIKREELLKQLAELESEALLEEEEELS